MMTRGSLPLSGGRETEVVLSVVVTTEMVACGGQEERQKLVVVCAGGAVMCHRSWLKERELVVDCWRRERVVSVVVVERGGKREMSAQ